MKKYRIVTNGINYRVQWFGKTFFLRRPKWYYLREYTLEFTSITEAQQAIKCTKEYFIAKKRGYIPVTIEHQS